MNRNAQNSRNLQNNTESQSGFSEQVVNINRVSKKTKGGNKMGFAALAVVGDKNGKVGIGLGKAMDVSSAIRKAITLARKHMVGVPIVNGTIPLRVDVKLGAAKIMLKPAPPGSGIIAGGAVRSVVAAAGIQNISSKVLGTKNQANNVYATMQALKEVSQRFERMSAERKRRNK
jgi:small subunit ribosomal protein S5